MSEPISLVVVRNPFDRNIRDERSLSLDQMPTVFALVNDYLPASADLSVAIDGEVITREEWESRTIKPGEQIVVMPVVHDSDSLGVVLMIAVAVMAPWAAGVLNTAMGLGFATGSMGMMLLTAGVQMLGSAIIGGLLAPHRPNLPSNGGTQSYNNSPAYSWNPATTQQPGGPVARAYGRHKLYGNIIAGYISNAGSTGQEQTAHLLIDLGTGPYSSLYDFKINDQPLGNYAGVKITTRMGHVNQDTIPAFNDTLLNRQIGAKVVDGSPVVRETVGNDYDALEIVLICPGGLWYANDSGGMNSLTVRVAVEISDDDGATWTYAATEPRTVTTVLPGYWSYGYWIYQEQIWAEQSWYEIERGSYVKADHYEGERKTPYDWRDQSAWHWMDVPTNIATTIYDSVTLTGASQQPVRKTIRVDNLNRGTRYKVRCTNLSPDQTTSRYGDDLYLSEINEVMYDDFQYPRTVLVAVDALATDQLSGSLKFSCRGDCAIVRVWDGAAWSSQWSNNPAWICWDILTQPVLDNSLNVVRYDGHDPSRLILSTFKAWADFCDTLVPDGFGGMEARCTFDGIFDTATSTWEAALEVCAVARAQLVPRGTSVAVVFDDARATPAQLFSVGNTAVSGFRETYLKMEDRAASIECNYLDESQDFARTTLTVVNPAITESAAQRTQIGLRGIIRASQAWRETNVRLKRNELLRRSGSISVDIDALACTVGDLIWIQSDMTRWGVGGLAASGSTTTRLALDRSITLDAGKTYELKLRLADDTLVTRAITTPAGTVSAVDVSIAFPSAPALYDVWAIGETGKAVKEFLVLDVTRDGDQRAKLDLIEYNASLYGLDSNAPPISTPNVSASPSPSISNLRAEEIMERAADGTILVHLDLHYDIADAVKGAAYVGGVRIGESLVGKIRYANVTSGATYTVTVRPETALGEIGPVSGWQTVTHLVIGKDALPADVANLTLDGARLTWPAVGDIDLAGYRIKFQYGANLEWGTANPLHAGLVGSSPYTMLMVPPGQVTIMVRAVDTSGNESANSAYVITNFGDSLVANVVESRDFKAAAWPGSIVNATVIGGNLQATQNDPFYKADNSNFYGEDGTPFYAPNYDPIEWISEPWTPTLAAAGSNMTVAFTLTGDAMAVQYRPTGPNPFYGDDSSTFYGTDSDLFYDAVPDWSPWPGSIVADNQEYQWRVATSSGPNMGLLSGFTASVDVPDKILILNNVAIAAGGTRLTAAIGQFNVIQNVQLTLQGGSTAMRLEVQDKSVTLGPLITAENAALAGVDANIDATIQGY